MPIVNPEVLIWARESMGFSTEEAAKKIGLHDGVRASAVKKLAAIETGEKAPTRRERPGERPENCVNAHDWPTRSRRRI
ncbi:MAG: hypothetical protein ACNYPE_14125 [Candidatus Azotimanducaceae bacterium WSBS_2022_MAG_OTU7]